MTYTPTTWENEVPASTPVKYVITDDTAGEIAASATIAPVTSITPGTAVDATNMNKIEQGIVDLETALGVTNALAAAAIPSCAAMSTTLSARPTADSTETVLSFGSLLYDPTGLCWSAGATDQLAIPAAGLYLIYVNAIWASNATGSRRITVTYGIGGTLTSLTTLPTVSLRQTLVCLRYFSAASNVKVQAYQTSGDTLNVVSCDFGIARIG